MKKQLFKRLFAFALASMMSCNNPLPLIQNLPLAPAITASAASCCSFDEETGVLTLSGFIDKDAVQAYSNNSDVKSVVIADSGAVFPTDCSYMFYQFRAKTIDLSRSDTSHVTNMDDMFYYCWYLESLNVSSFDTSRVTSMNMMFDSCTMLKSLDVSSFDTSHVTNLARIFCNCRSLTSLDISNFDTSSARYLGGMFSDCWELTSVDVSHFDTHNCISLPGMFNACSSLTSLDVSNFDTGKVEIMQNMFCGCNSLTSLDLSNFNTENVKKMGGMFNCCSSLKELDLSSFDTSKVEGMDSMFRYCEALTELDICSFDTSKLNDTNGIFSMFDSCSKLKTIYVSDLWCTDQITVAEYTPRDNMFRDCTALVGGNGTLYDSEHIDRGYAHIDTTGNPGYLTKCPLYGKAGHIAKKYYGRIEDPGAPKEETKQPKPAMLPEQNTQASDTHIQSENASSLKGDLNCSGDCTVSDAVMLCRLIAEDKTLEIPSGGIANADVNSDQIISILDMTALLRILGGDAPEESPEYFFLLGNYSEDTKSIEFSWICSGKPETFDILKSADGSAYTLLDTVTVSEQNFYILSNLSESAFFKASYTNEDQKTVESNVLQIIVSEDGITLAYPDSDGDGVEDIIEDAYGTAPDQADTDADGLTDFQEIYQTGTDPTKYDSFTGGVADANADSDGDGISNIDEIAQKTNPAEPDTDDDGLTDGDELEKYHTDPLLADTDSDGLRDAFEVQYGLDPLSPSTDGINDAERQIEQIIAPGSFALGDINREDNPYIMSVCVKINGDAEQQVSAVKSGYAVSLSNDAQIGDIFDLELPEDSNAESIRMEFLIKEQYRDNTLNMYTAGGEYQGIERLYLFRYFPEIGMMLPLDTQYNTEKHIVYADVTEGGTYCLMDMEIWFDLLDIDPELAKADTESSESLPLAQQVQRRPESQLARTVPIDVVFMLQTAGPDFSEAYFQQEIEQIHRNCKQLFKDYDYVQVYVVQYGLRQASIMHFNGQDYCTNISALMRELRMLKYSTIEPDNYCNTSIPFRLIKKGLNLRKHSNVFVYHMHTASNQYLGTNDGISLINSGFGIFSQIVPKSYKWLDEKASQDLSDAIKKNKGMNITLSDLSETTIYDHIEKNLDLIVDDREFTIRLGSGLRKITLADALDAHNGCDTDGDSISDWKEIMNQYVHYDSNGNLVLPTIEDLLNDPKFKYYAASIVRSVWYKNNGSGSAKNAILASVLSQTVLPFFSDPTSADSDGDGFPDLYCEKTKDVARYYADDPRPLISDVKTIHISHWDKGETVDPDDDYLPISDSTGAKPSYGSAQGWFENMGLLFSNDTITGKNAASYGCGLIATGDLIAYLGLYFDQNLKKYVEQQVVKYHSVDTDIAGDTDCFGASPQRNNILKSKYLMYLNLLSNIVIIHPKYLHIVYGAWPNPILGVHGSMEDALNDMFAYCNSNLKAAWLKKNDYVSLKPRIIEMLRNDIPVTIAYDNFMQGNRLMLYKDYDNIEKGVYEKDQTIGSHYVNITALIEYSDSVQYYVGHKTIAQISTWGLKRYFDFDEYVDLVNGTEDFSHTLTPYVIANFTSTIMYIHQT